jgi:adenine-specific DNA-methyltransferase
MLGSKVATYKGRLELTWTNKHLRLLAHDDGAYEWVPPADYRVAEVRLLHDAGVAGEVHPDRDRAKDNLLIRGDALNALTSLIELPEFAREYVGKVKLAYLDPPFNTQQSFLHYDDALEHSVWLTMMRDRLVQVKQLLAPSGSVWVHLDDSEMHRARCVMDEVFGPENFVVTIVWEKDKGRRSDTDISAVHDYIIVYARDHETWRGTRNLIPRSDAQVSRYRNPDNDPRGPWLQGDNSTAKSGSENSRWPIETPSGRIAVPPAGRYWAFSRQTFNRALSEGRVYFGRKGDGLPIIKTYLAEAQQGVVPRTWWPADEAGFNQEAKRDHLKRMFPQVEPFATPKPERLLHRVIQIGTNPDDIVLDCFLGSGTTGAVAHKLGRRWVGIEGVNETLDTFTVPRLTKVVAGEDPGGITETAGWQGGGGFRVLDVAPSMFEANGENVFLSEWATNSKLAEATAAQLHFDYAYDAPFSGRRGRSRLAVVDGLVTKSVVRLLVSALPPDERVVVCGTALDPAARDLLRQLRPGSTARKIPQSILQDYRQATRWRQPVSPEPAHLPESPDPAGDGQTTLPEEVSA